MKRFAIVRKEDSLSRQRCEEICQVLIKYMVYDEKEPDLVISIGGDGTMLDACHQYLSRLRTTLFVGVHTGSLGFYTDYDHSEWQELVNDILKGEWHEDRRSLLNVEVGNDSFLALNEVRLEENHRTMVCDVYINDEFLECFRGNGLCVCTPSGSTAYNRSLGGSIVAASIPSMQLSEIAGIHHNAYRSLQSSLVLDEHAVITLKPRPWCGMILGVDRWIKSVNQENFEVKISVSKEQVRFARFRRKSLCHRLRRAFISE